VGDSGGIACRSTVRHRGMETGISAAEGGERGRESASEKERRQGHERMRCCIYSTLYMLSYDQSPRALTEREAHEAKHACSR
jgi:hypothetical protein